MRVPVMMLLGLLGGTAAADATFVDAHERTANIGYQVVVTHRGQTIVDIALGFADLDSHERVTRSTKFLVMSVTKAFTGAALAKAVTAGLIDAEAPASDYVTGVRALKSDKRTLNAFAAHLAGAPHRNHPERRALYDRHFATANDALAGLENRRWSRPGRYRYSSGNYMVLAAAIETAAEMPFTEYVEERILEPLGLTNTGFQDVNDMSGVARNYSLLDVWDYDPVDAVQTVPRFDYSYNQGGGSMVANAADLAQFGEAFLQPGFFSAEEFRLVHDAIDERSEWSYGWIRSMDPNGRKRLLISGATIGVMASLMVYPEEQMVVATTVNCWCKDSRAAELIFGAPERFVDAYLTAIPE